MRRIAASVGSVGLVTAGFTVVATPARATPDGSVVVYQCGTAVCTVDPDVPGSERTLAVNAVPAGVTRDGKTAGVMDRAGWSVRSIALAPGGVSRRMAEPSDPRDFPTLSDSGASVAWTWYYAGTGWYAFRETPPAARVSVSSSTLQLSIGWKGEQVMTARRGATGYDSRICLDSQCTAPLVSEPDRTQHLAFPDIDAQGSTVVAVRGPETTGVGLPYYGPLAVYAAGSRTGPARILTRGRDSHPEFSHDGDRIVFERENQGIWVVNVDGTGLRKVTDGSLPFWGGRRSGAEPHPSPLVGSQAALARPQVRPVHRPVRKVRVRFSCPVARPGGCAGKVALRARASGKRGSRGAGKVLARAGYTIGEGRTATVELRATKQGRRLLARGPRTKALLLVTASRPTGLVSRFRVTVRRKR